MKFGNHAVEDGAVVERHAVLLGVRDGAGPVFGAVRQADEVLDSDRGHLGKQRAMQVAGRGVDDGGGVGAGRRRIRGGSADWRFGCRRRCLRSAKQGCREYQDKRMQIGFAWVLL